MNEEAFRAAVERYRRRMIWRLKAGQLLASVTLPFLKLRYHLLCFKHFGWRRLAIFILQTPEHFKTVGFYLFTHGASPSNASSPSAKGETPNDGNKGLPKAVPFD